MFRFSIVCGWAIGVDPTVRRFNRMFAKKYKCNQVKTRQWRIAGSAPGTSHTQAGLYSVPAVV